MSWIKISAINILVLFGLVAILELAWFFYQNNFHDNEQCQLDWVAYN